MRMKRALWMVLGLALAPGGAVVAGEVEVVAVEVSARSDGLFTFSVTLRHADEGWEHYADQWEVVSMDGETVYGRRVLFHPHVNEQPFTRFLSEVAVPAGVAEVAVRAHDKVHGLGGVEMKVALPGR
jgi:hypothetical protein